MAWQIAAATIGSSLLGGLIDEFQGTQELQDLEWGAERTKFADRLTEALEARGEEAINRLRLESQRSGTAMGGAYLEGVSEVENELNELMAKEMSKFEVQQAREKRAWAKQRAKFSAQQQMAENKAWQERIGNIGGALAGHWQSQREEELFNKMLTKMPTPSYEGTEYEAKGFKDSLDWALDQFESYYGDKEL